MIPKFDGKIFNLSILLFFALLLPISLAHESGHAIACSQAGHEAGIGLSFRGMYTTCEPDLNSLAFNLAGPVAGLVAAVGIFSLGYAISLKHHTIGSSLLIVGIAFTV